jgi:hypothetical protein
MALHVNSYHGRIAIYCCDFVLDIKLFIRAGPGLLPEFTNLLEPPAMAFAKGRGYTRHHR